MFVADNFLKNHLARFYSEDPDSITWLTAGFHQQPSRSPTASPSEGFVWHVRGGNNLPVTYVGEWSPTANETTPKTDDVSIVLRRRKIDGVAYDISQFDWDTVGMEMNVTVEKRTTYPFICEARANSKFSHAFPETLCFELASPQRDA
jgi:hypothetical protein